MTGSERKCQFFHTNREKLQIGVQWVHQPPGCPRQRNVPCKGHHQPLTPALLLLPAASGLQSHDLSLSGKRQAECINSSETQALGGFFFRCISHLRCGTDGESAACASTPALGVPRVSDRWDKTLEGSKHVWHHSCGWKRGVKPFSIS